MRKNNIYNMDCVEGMKLLDSESIDMVITSPPYDNLRTYNGFEFNFEYTAKELYRVIKQGGVIAWIVGDQTKNGSESGTSFRQALYFKELGLNLHDTMIYAKENYVPLTHNRYEQQFEYMFILSKGKPKTFNPFKRANKHYGALTKGTLRELDGGLRAKNTKGSVKKESIKPNIWWYSIGKSKSSKDNVAYQHPAIFPEQLVSDHIVSWSNKDDLILDPFMGSGTTAKMCLLLNRDFIGFEISKEYCEIANKRIDILQRQQKLF